MVQQITKVWAGRYRVSTVAGEYIVESRRDMGADKGWWDIYTADTDSEPAGWVIMLPTRRDCLDWLSQR